MAFLEPGAGPIAFAHRGFDPEGAENTMAAFQRAVDLGYRYLETDVRASADGVALAFHDATLDRVTDRGGPVAALPYRDLAAVRVRGREPIPLLVDVLATWPDARINLDIKTDAALGPVLDAIAATGSLARVCVGSFSGPRLAAVRRIFGPLLCTALGPSEVLRLRATGRGDYGANRCAQVPARLGVLPVVDRRFVAAAHRCGLPVHVYTVDDAAEMVRLLDLGVDGLMSDRADTLRDVLAGRGQWPT